MAEEDLIYEEVGDMNDNKETKKKNKSFFYRLWDGLFRSHGDDFEKRLKYISKEEATLLDRMDRRSLSWRATAKNIIIVSVILEVVALAYAILTTRTVVYDWKMRALRVLPVFVLPALSSALYWVLLNITKMRDHMDHKTLEKLRAERQEKIDELKERTNYYTTQQLIQRYDPDPAAKAAAASVLASKLGADTGLKVFVSDDLLYNSDETGMSNDVEPVKSSGLRRRNPSDVRSRGSSVVPLPSRGTSVVPRPARGRSVVPMPTRGTSVVPRPPRGSSVVPLPRPDKEAFHQASNVASEAPSRGELVVEHQNPTDVGTQDGGWIARVAALLVGEDPTQSYALICGNCHMHNGLAMKEDFPVINYYCPHCRALNKPRNSVLNSPENTSSPTAQAFSRVTSRKASPVGSPVGPMSRAVSGTTTPAFEREAIVPPACQ